MEGRPRLVHPDARLPLMRRDQPSTEISVPAKRPIHRIEQSGVAERLEQALDRTLFDELLANRLVGAGGNGDNRNLAPVQL